MNEKFTIVTPQSPTAPTGLAVSSLTVDTVNLTWTAVADAAGYNVYRSTSSDGTYTKINTVPVTSSSFTDTGLTDSTTYYYSVTAVNLIGESEFSAEVSAITLTPPSIPANIAISACTGNSVTLSWAFDSNSKSYNVYRSTSNNGPFVKINTVPGTTNSYVDNGLTPGATYYYKVSGVNLAGESALSETVAATTIPAAPTGLTISSSTADSISLNWDAAVGATGYNVYRSVASDGTYEKVNTSSIAATSYTDTGLTPGTAYFYIASAVNQFGESAQSSNVPATTLPAAPTGLTAGPSTNISVSLTWSDTVGAAGYNVYRSATSDGTYEKVNTEPVTSTSYTDTGLNVGNIFYYKASAYSAAGESALSSSITLKTFPAAPTGLDLSSNTTDSINLTWSAAAGDRAITYIVRHPDLELTENLIPIR